MTDDEQFFHDHPLLPVNQPHSDPFPLPGKSRPVCSSCGHDWPCSYWASDEPVETVLDKDAVIRSWNPWHSSALCDACDGTGVGPIDHTCGACDGTGRTA